MKSRWFGLVFIAAAIPLYLAGMAAGAVALFALGAILEIAGWVRLLGPRRT